MVEDFINFRRGELIKLMSMALDKASSERELSKATGIPKVTIYHYKKEKRKITKERATALINYLELGENFLNKEKIICKHQWLSEGGKKSYQTKLKNGTFSKNLKKMNMASSRLMTKWHRKMRMNKKREYHIIQYERFKKVAEYKYSTLRGEKVRNTLEKQVADFLFELNAQYEYEPYIEGKNNVFFPDFKIKDLIIECTMWKGIENAYRLKNKIRDLRRGGYKVIVIVPKELNKEYKIIKRYTINNLNELRNILPR